MSEQERLDQIYKVFVKWKALPESTRDPKTPEEWAKKAKVKVEDLVEFEERETYTDDLYKASIKWGKAKVPELLHLVYGKYITTKNPNDLKIFKELLNLDKGDNAKKSEAEQTMDGILSALYDVTSE